MEVFRHQKLADRARLGVETSRTENNESGLLCTRCWKEKNTDPNVARSHCLDLYPGESKVVLSRDSKFEEKKI